MKKLAIFLAAILVFASIFSLAACGKKDTEAGESKGTATDTATTTAGWDYIANKGELIIGLDDTFAPMGFRDENNNLVGFDIDLANAVAKELGIKAKFQPIDWNSKELELESKNIDCIWNGMSATPERQQSMSLTKKYLNNQIILVAAEGVTINSKDDLKNLDIATQEGSAALESLEADEKYDTFKENVVTYPDYDAAIMDMKAGRIDCIAIDKVLAEYKISKMDENFTIPSVNFGDDFYAIGCRKADPDVAAKISDAIQVLIANGEAAKISEKWFGTNIVILEDYE